ncbi:helix-turn-helix transcriptional regulator [uncultured Halomonas sp.]|uniref:helix-turn-helix transcriptional regulator n=1 Tax=uncultured Halomonas sp. TaxID=173971 RepID=UPI00262ADDFA|nr:helix-turn-helix transcriptional regulator [uncultured Halomonas sp.]
MKGNEIIAISELISALGTKDFGLQIDNLTKTAVSFDMSCIFLFGTDRTAVLVHDGYSESVSRKALASYLRGGYLLDPFYVACTHDHPPGLWRMSDLAPDSFFSSGFIVSKDIHPCVSSEQEALVEEVGFIIPLGENLSAVYSLMRHTGKESFSHAELSQIKFFEPIISSSISRHCKSFIPSAKIDVEEKKGGDGQFADIFQGRLTSTQRDVAKLILRGHSSSSIALIMNITKGTVKLHKSNIYKRLSISSQSELFRMFIDYLEK